MILGWQGLQGLRYVLLFGALAMVAAVLSPPEWLGWARLTVRRVAIGAGVAGLAAVSYRLVVLPMHDQAALGFHIHYSRRFAAYLAVVLAATLTWGAVRALRRRP